MSRQDPVAKVNLIKDIVGSIALIHDPIKRMVYIQVQRAAAAPGRGSPRTASDPLDKDDLRVRGGLAHRL